MSEDTWTTDQLRAEFEVMGFSMGLVVVRRKADGVVGSMRFTPSMLPDGTRGSRLYYGWEADK